MFMICEVEELICMFLIIGGFRNVCFVYMIVNVFVYFGYEWLVLFLNIVFFEYKLLVVLI